jgi:hypothetical protein
MTIRVANAAGFLGDWLEAPRRTVEAAEVDYLTLEYLAELTLSILARLRQKNQSAGYANDFLEVLRSLAPALYLQSQLKIVTNAGGVNPTACAARAGAILSENGSGDLPVAVVTGDDLLERLEELIAAGCPLTNLDSGLPYSELRRPVVSANAYLGAAPIAEALGEAARLVITGRVADASLTLGPAAYEFGWKWDQWNRLGAASVAGHLIECGAQVTGGYSTNWADYALADIGYPIAEIEANGEAVITKPPGTGGVVTRRTVIEQLIYEIGDPQHYLTPDVDVDFTTVEVEELGNNRVQVRGGTGRPAPDSYKVSLAYHDGFTAAGQMLVYGNDCVAKARAAAEVIQARLQRAGIELARSHVELLGTGAGVPGGRALEDLPEVMLRIAVRDPRREAVERFTKEFAPLITSGPAGLAGYAAGRSPVRPVFAYWPTLVPRDLVAGRVEVRTAQAWAETE